MKHKLLPVALICLGALSAQAADWSDNAIGYRYAPRQSEPGVSDKVSKNILNYTHVSGDKLGMNLFTIDLLKSNGADPAAGGTGGAQEWYGFYKRSFSLTALTGQKTALDGLVKDVNLTARFDAGAKNTDFAPAPRKFRPGVSFDLPVKAGFWNVGLDAYKETNHNSFADPTKPNQSKSVSFKTAWALSSAWAIPAGPGTFGGFLDVVGPKGQDGFGADTKTETLLRATYMYDVDGPKGALKAGVGIEYWKNKFGCDNSSAASSTSPGGITNTCKATTPLLLVEYHL